MGELQNRLNNIAEVCGKIEFSAGDMCLAFGVEIDECTDFKNMYFKIGKEICRSFNLLLVCVYLAYVRV